MKPADLSQEHARPVGPRTPSRDRQFQFALDTVVLLLSYSLSWMVRFDFAIPDIFLRLALVQAPLVLLLQLAAAARCGIYSFSWRYVGLSEIRPFLQAALLVMAPLALLRFTLPDTLADWRVPISIIVLSQVFGFGGMLALRVLRRLAWEGNFGLRGGRLNRPLAVVVGAGRAGAAVARELRHAEDFRLVGLLDDDPSNRNLAIHGSPVLGTIDSLPRVIEKHGISLVIVAIRHPPRRLMRRLIETCKQAGVAVKVVPSFDELLRGDTTESFRSLEIEDLLGRDPVELDQKSMRAFLTDRTVLVTGAGGSIGAEICRQVASFAPASLLLMERAEFALFEIHRELAKRHPTLAVRALVADVGDETRVRSILAEHRPEVVVHAAAHKHVSLMEQNPAEAIKNNVIATRTLGEACARSGVDTFIQISTDKAVHPTSVMGASKRLAELVIQSLNERSDTRFVAVRFGNVMGSAGSVVPIFRNQIAEGGPVTVTDPDMVRYFMTIPEASQLVLQAGALSRGGEIMVLDMGEPVRILDLAEDMIRLSGFRPYEEIEIQFTGRGRGEKLSEELGHLGELSEPTLHPKILTGPIEAPSADFAARLEQLLEIARLGLEHEIRKTLSAVLQADGSRHQLESELDSPGDSTAERRSSLPS